MATRVWLCSLFVYLVDDLLLPLFFFLPHQLDFLRCQSILAASHLEGGEGKESGAV